MDWPRKVAVSLIATGAFFCCLYLVPTVYGGVMSHLEVAAFRAQSHSNSLWDSGRIRAYKSTLGLQLPPPEAILRVPGVGIEVPVLEGTSAVTMNRGIGHIAGTALPGQTGNIALTGHRDGFFRPLKDVHPGDLVELEHPSATSGAGSQTDRYVVRTIHIVFPSDTSVLNATSGSTLTLITCYPFYYVGSAPQRYIVQAELVSPASVLSHSASQKLLQIPGE